MARTNTPVACALGQLSSATDYIERLKTREALSRVVESRKRYTFAARPRCGHVAPTSGSYTLDIGDFAAAFKEGIKKSLSVAVSASGVVIVGGLRGLLRTGVHRLAIHTQAWLLHTNQIRSIGLRRVVAKEHLPLDTLHIAAHKASVILIAKCMAYAIIGSSIQLQYSHASAGGASYGRCAQRKAVLQVEGDAHVFCAFSENRPEREKGAALGSMLGR